MLSRTACSIFRASCTRGLCVTSTCQAPRFIPHELLKSQLVSSDGLMKEKIKKTQKKAFVEQEHHPSQAHSYGTLNITVRGYDLVIVEKFAQFIHRFVEEQKIPVKEVYALPPEFTTMKHIINKFTANALDMATEADVPKYTRIVQISDLKSTFASLLIKSLIRDVPPGVELSVTKFTEEDFLKRYKENKELQTAKEDLARLWSMR